MAILTKNPDPSKNDVAIGIGLEAWKRESSATSDAAALKKAYEACLASIESRCNDLRDGKGAKKAEKPAAPAVEEASAAAATGTVKPGNLKGKGKGAKGKKKDSAPASGEAPGLLHIQQDVVRELGARCKRLLLQSQVGQLQR